MIVEKIEGPVTAIGAADGNEFCAVLGGELFRLVASIDWDGDSSPEPGRRIVKLSLVSGNPDHGYFLNLYILEDEAVTLSNLIARFVRSEAEAN